MEPRTPRPGGSATTLTLGTCCGLGGRGRPPLHFFGHRKLIVDKEDSFVHDAGLPAFSGRRTKNVVPCPTLLSKESWP